MTSEYCSCNCKENNYDSYDENPNFITACGNNPLEKDPEIVHCPSCFDFEAETDNSRSSNDFCPECRENYFDDSYCQDILFVDANRADLNDCEDESTLMERVWFLSKPPLIQKQVFTIPARMVQVIRERLSSTVKCIPTLKEDLKLQIKKNMNAKRLKKKNAEYVPVRRIAFEYENEDSEIILPPCAQKLSVNLCEEKN